MISAERGPPSASRARDVGMRARDFTGSRVRNPLRSSAFRWSFTPFVERMSSASPISRIVGGYPASSICRAM
jgi:hypothetical protein